jgi:hypothetical protein
MLEALAEMAGGERSADLCGRVEQPLQQAQNWRRIATR